MAVSYRDPIVGQKQRVVDKAIAAKGAIESLTPIGFAILPNDLRERIDALRPLASELDTPPDHELADREQDLDRLLAALSEADGVLPPLLRAEATPLPLPRSHESMPYMYEEAPGKAVRRAMANDIRRFDPKATIERVASFTYASRLHVDGTEFIYLTDVYIRNDGQNQSYRLEFALQTRAPAGYPRASFVPHSLRFLFRDLFADNVQQVSDPAFDDAFRITGPRAFVRALATPNIRERMGALAEYKLELHTEPDVVTLRWAEVSVDRKQIDLLRLVGSPDELART